MADQKPTTKISGWIKAGVTSMCGVVGGAALMYVSPLVNSAIKPGKPIANFSYQAQGLTVTFQNRSNAGEGWWDFGDGSALEPFVASQETIAHTYARPGMYTAKLSLRNFLGDENDRAITVNLDGAAANTGPAIEGFQLISLKPGETAPATFRVVARVKNAETLIWSLGDERPLEISNDVNGTQDRIITLKEPGSYKIRLVAVSGKQTAEQSGDAYVSWPDNTIPMAALGVAYDAVKIERKERKINMGASFPPAHGDSTFAFSDERPAEGGWHIVEAKFGKATFPAYVQDPKLELSPEKTRVRLTGVLIKQTGLLKKNVPPPNWFAEVLLTMEKRSAPTPKSVDAVAMDLKTPGTTILPIPSLPPGWVMYKRNMQLELRDGPKTVFKDTRMPQNAPVQIGKTMYRITAHEQGDQIRLDLTPEQVPARPVGLKKN